MNLVRLSVLRTGRLHPSGNNLGTHFCWCVRLTTLPPSCAVVTKSGNLNFLEPSGPLQACDGTALPSYSFLLEAESWP